MTRDIPWVLGALILAIGVAGAAPVGKTVVLDRSIAHVNDGVIWERDLEARAKGMDATQRAQVLEEMINEELVVAEGRRAGITTEPSEIDAALTEIKTQNQLDDAHFATALHEAGYTMAQYRIDLDRQLIRLRAINQLVAPQVEVTDADVDAEAKRRGVALPVEEPAKSIIRTDLRRKAIDAKTVVWLETLREHATIERRP